MKKNPPTSSTRRPKSRRMRPSSLVPMAFVRSVERSIRFYQKLGFEVGNTHTPEGSSVLQWAWLWSGDAHLMVSKASEPVDPESQAILFYIYCPDVTAFRKSLIRRGIKAGRIRHPFWSPRGEFPVTDPDGYALMVSHTRR